MTHLTPEQLAERLSLSTETLANWRLKGGGPSYIKISRQTVRYPLAQVEAWERAKLQRSTVG